MGLVALEGVGLWLVAGGRDVLSFEAVRFASRTTSCSLPNACGLTAVPVMALIAKHLATT